jgi:hypothetical protein
LASTYSCAVLKPFSKAFFMMSFSFSSTSSRVQLRRLQRNRSQHLSASCIGIRSERSRAYLTVLCHLKS